MLFTDSETYINRKGKKTSRFFLWLVWSIISIALWIVEATTCKTYKFIENITHCEFIFEEINNNRAKSPEVTYNIQNYTGSGKSRTNTHKASEPFRYSQWVD